MAYNETPTKEKIMNKKLIAAVSIQIAKTAVVTAALVVTVKIIEKALKSNNS